MSSISPRPNPNPADRSPLEGAAAQPFGPAPAGQALVARAAAGDPPRFRPQVRRSLTMRPLLAGAIGLMTLLLCFAAAFKQPSLYKAQSLIYVEPIVTRALNEPGAPGFDQLRYNSYIEQQMQTITRDDILSDALHTLPEGTWAGTKEREQSAIGRLQTALVVERVLTSYQISISLKTPNAQKSAAIVNAVTEAYLRDGRKDELSEAGSRVQILTEERDRITQQLATDRKEQAALGTSLGVAYPSAEGSNYFDEQLVHLREALAVARQAHDVAAAQLSSVSGSEAEHRSGLAAAADESIGSDPGLGSMKTAVNGRRAILESQMAGLTANNPLYKQDADELADLDRSLDTMTAQMRSRAEDHIQDKLRSELQRTAAIEAQLNSQLAAETGKATSAGPKLQRASELAADMQRLSARYSAVDDALNALKLQADGPSPEHLALAAAAPSAPEANRRNFFFLAAFPLAILLSISAAVLARLFDRRIFIGADLEQALGFAPLAVLPAREDVAPRVFEEYSLRLAAGIEGAYRRASARTFVLTAVGRRADTDLLLQSLASKLRELRLNVAVVRAGELLMTSEFSREHTLASSLASDGIASTKLERLKVQHDLVLIDAAPLLESAETEYVVRSADATVLIVTSGVTLTTELVAATTLLARLRVNGVAAVLQQLRVQSADPVFRGSLEVVQKRYQTAPMAQPAPHEDAPAVPVKPRPRPVEVSEPLASQGEAVNEPYAVSETPALHEADASNRHIGLVDTLPAAVPFLHAAVAEPTLVSEAVNQAAESQPTRPILPEEEATPEMIEHEPALVTARSAVSEKVHLVESAAAATSEAAHPVLEIVSPPPQEDPEAELEPAYATREQAVNGPAHPYTRSRLRLAMKDNDSASRAWFTHLLNHADESSIRVAPSLELRPSDRAKLARPEEQASGDAGDPMTARGSGSPLDRSKADMPTNGGFDIPPRTRLPHEFPTATSTPAPLLRRRRAFARLDEIDRGTQAALAPEEPTKLAAPAQKAPELTPEPALTRRWGLLSKFDDAATVEGTSPARAGKG